ncbi:MAG: PIN domain-containing protein [Proteobacteria bacterium]|jgi:predicted nucleic acid-binding protein|nr:PIN domain-containing protein [Pseudomonadota bacterium]
MPDKVFVDTNILIYAHDSDAGRKRELASAILVELWQSRRGTLSTQVLQEFYVNVTRKIAHPLDREVASEIVERYAAWRPISGDHELLLSAFQMERRFSLSFWDAMIAAAAVRSGAKTLLTEDLQHGQLLDSIRIENPFL